MRPAVGGEPWGMGAVSAAEWTGVPLAEVLDRTGIESGAREVLFRGADGGSGERFERSLSLEDVAESEVLLAYAMNGEPLPVQHGHPLRVIVPGWYAVTAVKWLTEIDVIGHSFHGQFQTQKYVYEWQRDGQVLREPVRRQRVRALITQPAADEMVDRGLIAVRGLAWSGMAAVASVEVSVNGRGWQPARLLGPRHRYSWQRWELIARIDRPGRTTIRARATDQAGHTQPDRAEWNRLGYGNNAIQEVAFRAVG
jgi:DMSO/TMAO reductase YedYZ molybdopterin-dependent catalytic subunit